MFTYQYVQPPEYHFSLDSIHLAEFVAARLQSRNNLDTLRILDLCAGCGVIGFELSYYVKELKHLDFVEIQDIYTEYFFQNVATVNRSELQLNWHLLNYDQLLKKEWQNKFDLIVSNPPYFQAGKGMLSPSHFKNRCRFYLDSTFKNFILAICNTLADQGEAYFLLRSAKQHGDDLFGEINLLLDKQFFSVEKAGNLRGHDVVLIKKHY